MGRPGAFSRRPRARDKSRAPRRVRGREKNVASRRPRGREKRLSGRIRRAVLFLVEHRYAVPDELGVDGPRDASPLEEVGLDPVGVGTTAAAVEPVDDVGVDQARHHPTAPAAAHADPSLHRPRGELYPLTAVGADERHGGRSTSAPLADVDRGENKQEPLGFEGLGRVGQLAHCQIIAPKLL